MPDEFAAQVLRAALQHVLDRFATISASLLSPESLATAVPGAVLPADVAALATDLGGARTELVAASTGTAGPVSMVALRTVAQHLTAALGHLGDAANKLGVTLPAVLATAVPAVPALGGLAAQLGLGSAPPGISATAAGVQYELAASGVTIAGVGLAAERVALVATAGTDGSLELAVALSGLRVAVPGSGALLGAVLGGGGAAVRADVRLGIDTNRGLRTDGVLGPIEVPARRELGPVAVKGLAISVADDDGEAAVTLVAGLEGRLGGVLGVEVDGVGVRLPIDPGAVTAGNAPVGAPELVPPSGLGASLSAGPIAGGGYLAHLPVTGHPDWTRYGGALRLRLGPVDVKAYGVLTERPDGLSLVVVMSVEFTPAIELGLAFTLNGVGGIVGLDVTADTDALQAAARSGALSQLLFPPDPVTAAPQILQLLQAIFPVAPGGLVVGPMLAMGWGRPISFVRVDLAVVLSLPDPTVILLGRVRVALPLPDAALIDLNAEIYGEFSDQRVLVIVSLVDSRVGFLQVSGDIGLLLRFGDEPNFAISAGGFHPAFAPPAELGSLRRVAVDMSPPFGLTLHAEAYVAITPVTVQFGGRVEAAYVVGPAAVRGYLGVDAIVHLDPFGFVVDLTAGVSVEAFDVTLCGVDLALHLEGPSPWRIGGSGKIRLPWPLPDPSIDLGPYQWGSAPPPPPGTARPLDLVVAALGRAQAWGAVRAAGTEVPVQLRTPTQSSPPPDGIVVVDPWSLLRGTQSAVPLDTTIARVGAARVVAGQEKVVLDDPLLGPPGAAVAGAAWSVAQEKFALGQYLNLTDDQALAAPSFEDRAAGLTIDARGTQAVSVDDAIEVTLLYETFFPGREQDPPARNRGSLYARYDTLITLSATSAGRSELRAGVRYQEAADPVVVRPPQQVEARGTLDAALVLPDAMAWSDAFAMLGGGAVRAWGTGSEQVGAAGGVQLVGVGALS